MAAHPHSPESFKGKSTEEIQAHFEEQRLNGSVPQAKLHARRIKNVDLDEQFKRLLTVVDREITKLMDASHTMEPLDVKNHEAVIAYAKLIGGLKKQVAEQFKDMNPDEVEKLAADGP
jgi:RNA polymerase-interacting CarD/CdnL/TRCF family regulator